MGTSGPGTSEMFLTNHARGLIIIARRPAIRLRDVAALCAVTVRTAQGIVAGLEADGYLTHTREGRRNRYVIAPGTRFRHAAEADYEIVGLLALINGRAGVQQPGTDENGVDGGSDTGTGTSTGSDTDAGQVVVPARGRARSAVGG